MEKRRGGFNFFLTQWKFLEKHLKQWLFKLPKVLRMSYTPPAFQSNLNLLIPSLWQNLRKSLYLVDLKVLVLSRMLYICIEIQLQNKCKWFQGFTKFSIRPLSLSGTTQKLREDNRLLPWTRKNTFPIKIELVFSFCK